jgi:hypothetical protein
MTHSPSDKKKRNGDSTSMWPSDPDAHTESIKKRLTLLDFRLESLQRDFVNLTVSRRQVALARSQRARLGLEPADRKTGKKRKAD